MSPLAFYALEGVSLAVAIALLIWAMRHLAISPTRPTIAEEKKRSWR